MRPFAVLVLTTLALAVPAGGVPIDESVAETLALSGVSFPDGAFRETNIVDRAWEIRSAGPPEELLAWGVIDIDYTRDGPIADPDTLQTVAFQIRVDPGSTQGVETFAFEWFGDNFRVDDRVNNAVAADFVLGDPSLVAPARVFHDAGERRFCDGNGCAPDALLFRFEFDTPVGPGEASAWLFVQFEEGTLIGGGARGVLTGGGATGETLSGLVRSTLPEPGFGLLTLAGALAALRRQR